MNALAAYGTSSSSSSDSENEEPEKQCNEKKSQLNVSKLPKPEFGSSQVTVNNSVFVNPFVQAELAKSAILEKHVKMVEVQDKSSTINGKRVCWNHRRGRCRFGHNCKYAHDTDIHRTTDETHTDKQNGGSVQNEVSPTGSSQVMAPSVHVTPQPPDDAWEPDKRHRLKRPGLSQGIVPGKKVLKMYHHQKANSLKK